MRFATMAFFLVAINVAFHLVMKPRVVALTDRRMLLVQLTSILGRAKDIEIERSRFGLHASKLSKRKVLFESHDGARFTLRPDRRAFAAIQAWLPVERPAST